jgi:hypothetical protein
LAKRILIPNDLWHFVGNELIERGYMNHDALLQTIEIPKIRWLLLRKEEWQAYSHLDMLNLNNFKSKEGKVWEKTDYLNLYVTETFKRRKLLKKYPETKRLLVERGFINFDNVVLMSESRTEHLFNEINRKALSLFGEPLIFSLDSTRLATFILELIRIYKFRVGKNFTGKILNNGVLENQILLSYLKAHSISSQNFGLNTIVISKKKELNEKRFFKNMWNALNQKKPSILKDNKGKEIAKFNIGKLFREKDGRVHVNFGSLGLKVEGNFVGFGHILYRPESLGARNVQEVLASWDWLLEKTQIDSANLQMTLEACSLIVILKTGIEEGKDVNIFSLAINLQKLESLGIDTTSKIEEFREEIRGHIKSFWKYIEKKDTWRGILVAQKLREYLSNVSSECFLARVSKSYGFNVRLGKHPDLKIEGKGVEVKRANSYNLSSPIRNAQGQPHDIIAIEAKSLVQIEIPHYKAPKYETTWLDEGNLKDILKSALMLRHNGDIVLLFMATFEGLKGRIILLKQT